MAQKGTFADLYDAEQNKQATRPGRPRRKVKRKQVTLYLTPEQEETLTDLHYIWNKQIKVDRSDIAGLALELLAELAEQTDGILEFQNFKSLKFQLLQALKEQTIPPSKKES